jgi:hypothetical protein
MFVSLAPVAQPVMVLVYASKLVMIHSLAKLQTLPQMLKVVKKLLCSMSLTDLS